MIDLQDLLTRFPDATPTDEGYLARCPAHDDGDPSLCIFVKDTGRVVLYCRASCDSETIRKAVGLDAETLRAVKIPEGFKTKPRATEPAPDWARNSADGRVRRAAHALEVYGAYPYLAERLAQEYGIQTENLDHKAAYALGAGLEWREDEHGTAHAWVTVTARTTAGKVAWMQARDPREERPKGSPRWVGMKNPEGSRWDAVGYVGTRTGERPVIITEGASDALTLANLDAYDVLAIRGTKMIDRIGEISGDLVGRDVVIAFDNDREGAGQAAATRLLAKVGPISGSLRNLEIPRRDNETSADVRSFMQEEPATFAERFAALIEEAPYHNTTEGVSFDLTPYLAGTDLARAESVQAWLRAQGRDVAFNEAMDFVYWDGQTWTPEARPLVRQATIQLARYVREKAHEAASAGAAARAKAVAEAADPEATIPPNDHEKRAKELLSFARSFESYNATKAALAMLETLPSVYTAVDRFDAALTVGTAARSGDSG